MEIFTHVHLNPSAVSKDPGRICYWFSLYNVLVCLTCTIARKFSHPSILFLAGEELIIPLISKSHLERVMTGSQALSILCRARALSLTRPCTLSTVALTLQVQRLRDRNGPATELVSRNRDEKMWKKR